MPRLTVIKVWMSLLVALVASTTWSGQARAQPDGADGDATEDECVAAFDAAQSMRAKLELRAAKKQLESCARAECPSLIASDCGRWLTEVQGELPSIIIAAKDEAGADTFDVRVTRSGEVLAEKITVAAIELDPGEHALRFERAGAVVERTIVLRVGQRNERVEVTFEPVAPPPPAPAGVPSAEPPTAVPPPPDSGFGPLFYTGLGTAGLGLVVGAVFGGIAVSNKADIDERCPANCTQDDIDAAALPAHVSTAGVAVLGVGAVLVVVGLLVGPSSSREARHPLRFRF